MTGSGLLAAIRGNRTLSAVVAEGFLARLGFAAITFTLPFYAHSMGMGFTEIGLLASLRLVAAILVKPLMGYAADRFGKRSVYLWSIAGRTIVALLFAFAVTPFQLYAVRTLHGVTTAARDPSSAFLIAEHGEAKRMATSFAWYIAAKEVGASAGYLAAGFLLTLTADDYSSVFLFTVLTSAFSLLIASMFVAEHPRRVADEERPSRPLPPETPWRRFAALAVMIAACGNMVTYLFPLIATEYAGLSKGQTSLIFGLSSMTVLVGGPFFGWLSDNVSRGMVLSLRSVANSVSSLLYLLTGYYGALGARLCDDLGRAAFRPAWGALMAEVSASSGVGKRGRMIAYLDTAQTVGEALGPALAALIWDMHGLYWMLGVRFVLCVLTEIFAISLMKAK